MTEIVLDASVAVPALLATDERGFALQDRLAGLDCLAPHLIDAQVGNVLRKRVAAGAVEPANAEAALRAMQGLVVERFPHGPMAAAAWRLRDNLTYYDALYAALAARLDVTLLTADARLARAPGLPCDVELLRPASGPASSRSS